MLLLTDQKSTVAGVAEGNVTLRNKSYIIHDHKFRSIYDNKPLLFLSP